MDKEQRTLYIVEYATDSISYGESPINHLLITYQSPTAGSTKYKAKVRYPNGNHLLITY